MGMRTLTSIQGLLFFTTLVVSGVAGPRPKLPKEVVEGLASSPSITLYSLQPWGGKATPEQSTVLRKRLADWIATHPEPLPDR